MSLPPVPAGCKKVLHLVPASRSNVRVQSFVDEHHKGRAVNANVLAEIPSVVNFWAPAPLKR